MFSAHSERVTEHIRHAEISLGTTLVLENEGFFHAIELMESVKKKRGCIFVIGNGGSAGIASHFCVDLMKTRGIHSQTLYDSNVLTCFSNDFGYEHVFSHQLSLALRENDLVVAISSSGRSPNIVQAANVCRNKGIPLITFTGFSKNNPLKTLGDVNFWIDSERYGIVEMAHMCMLHTLIDLWPSSFENNEKVHVREYASYGIKD